MSTSWMRYFCKKIMQEKMSIGEHKLISIFILSLTLASCGNYKPNQLPEGVIDKSQFPFPPNEEYEYPEE